MTPSAVWKRISCTLCLAALAARPVHGETLHVPAQFPTIQAAINAAQSGDTILVADGTYSGSGNKGLSFRGPTFGVTIRSEGGPENCTIDCENSGGAFFMVTDEPPTVVIHGITVINGRGIGGAIFSHHFCRAVFRNCVFRLNAYSLGGTALCEDTGEPTFISCRFENNSATTGGAVHVRAASRPTFINCTFSENLATSDGGAIFASMFTGASFINCLIHDNQAAGRGGGAYAIAGATNFVCPTFSRNTAGTFGGAIAVRGAGSVSVVNGILWQDQAPAGPEIALLTNSGNGASLTIRHTNFQGGPGAMRVDAGSTLTLGPGNLDIDPLFANPLAGNFRLTVLSPSRDRGDTTAIPPDSRDLDNDGDTAEPLPFDRDGLPRVAGCAVDMGAFEFQSSGPGSGDLDGGGPGVSDLPFVVAALLDPSQPTACIADMNGDGVPNGLDVPGFTAALLGP